jgi:hypothetical protein
MTIEFRPLAMTEITRTMRLGEARWLTCPRHVPRADAALLFAVIDYDEGEFRRFYRRLNSRRHREQQSVAP